MPINGPVNLLETIGVVEYNGISLTGSELTAGIDMEVVYDSSGRSAEFVRLTFSFRKFFEDVDIDDALNKLTQPGGILKFTGLGWKDLVVNTNGVFDAEYGPKPSGLKWRRLGGKRYWELTNYTISTSIPFCYAGTPDYVRKIQSVTFTVDFDLDEEGMTTRSIAGKIKIPATRAAVTDRRLQDNADLYRNFIDPVVPLGFQKMPSKYGLSEDKRTITFSIVHKEINSDDAYPEGIVKVDCSESASNQELSFTKWDYSIGGSLTVARPFPRSMAWEKFLLILKNRMDWQRAKAGARTLVDKIDNQAAVKGGVPQLLKIRFEVEMFGRTAHFSVTWLLLTTLAGILKDSGMWTPLNTDWSRWRDSMSLIWGNRGAAGLKFENRNDIIIDLCEQGTTQDDPQPNRVTQNGVITEQMTDCPRANESWIEYKCWVEYRRDGEVIRHKPLPPPGGYTPGGTSTVPDTKKPGYDKEDDPKGGDFDASQKDIIQKLANPSYTIVVKGHAARAHFQIVEPKLSDVDGVALKPVENKGMFVQGIVGMTGDCPIYAAKWETEYMIDQAATTIPRASNPGL